MTVNVKLSVRTMINAVDQNCRAELRGDGSGEILFCDNYILT
jgi:hypothetical protein